MTDSEYMEYRYLHVMRIVQIAKKNYMLPAGDAPLPHKANIILAIVLTNLVSQQLYGCEANGKWSLEHCEGESSLKPTSVQLHKYAPSNL